MRSLLPVVLGCSGLLTGCSYVGPYFGYYKHEKAEWAPAEEAAAVRFPNSLEKGTTLTGPMLAALKVAMDEFRPPGTRADAQATPEDRCLARWENIDVRVFQANDNLFFVQFSPDLSKCAPDVIVLDSGAVYAVDGQGRILARE